MLWTVVCILLPRIEICMVVLLMCWLKKSQKEKNEKFVFFEAYIRIQENHFYGLWHVVPNNVRLIPQPKNTNRKDHRVCCEVKFVRYFVIQNYIGQRVYCTIDILLFTTHLIYQYFLFSLASLKVLRFGLTNFPSQ